MKELRINEKYESACPALSKDELERLESLILKDRVIYNPILIWNDVIIDGHNRYQIAKKHNIHFDTQEKDFNSDEEVIIWIKENAISQRNLTDFVKYELVKDIEALLLEVGRQKLTDCGKNYGISHSQSTDNKEQKPLSIIDKPSNPKHNTRQEVAKKLNWSTGKTAMAKVVEKQADEETKQLLRDGGTTIGRVYNDLKKNVPDSVDILESAAVSLERWVNKYSCEKIMFEFIKPVNLIIDKIRDKKVNS